MGGGQMFYIYELLGQTTISRPPSLPPKKRRTLGKEEKV